MKKGKHIYIKIDPSETAKRDMVINNLTIKEYRAILKFCKKKKINHTTFVYDKAGECVYSLLIQEESLFFENQKLDAELYD